MIEPFFDSNNHVGLSFYNQEVYKLMFDWTSELRKILSQDNCSLFIRTANFRFIKEIKTTNKLLRKIQMKSNLNSSKIIDIRIDYFTGNTRCTSINLCCIISRIESEKDLIKIRENFLKSLK